MITRTLSVIVMVLLICSTVFAETASLSWNAYTEPDIAKYNIYQSTESGVYDLTDPIGHANHPKTAFKVYNLEPNKIYFWVITAVNKGGMESKKTSNEVWKYTGENPLAPTGLKVE